MTDSRLLVVSDQSPFADALLARIARRSGLPVTSDRDNAFGADTIVLAGTGVDLGHWREWEDVALARKRHDEVTPCAVQVVPVDGCERCGTAHRDAREGALEDLRDLCGSR